MKPHVLIVDDNKALLAVLLDFLALQGFGVTIASDAAMARRVLRQETLDLIVMDIALGEMDGLELLSEFKLDFPAVPVIMITGMRPYAELAVEALSRGAAGFIHKCASPDELLREINRVLQLKPNEPASGTSPPAGSG
ncbi:MAG: response regulator [Verrucomicrobia bacterium]|nr:response regulator [Verrucomicrobiota bacterium]